MEVIDMACCFGKEVPYRSQLIFREDVFSDLPDRQHEDAEAHRLDVLSAVFAAENLRDLLAISPEDISSAYRYLDALASRRDKFSGIVKRVSGAKTRIRRRLL